MIRSGGEVDLCGGCGSWIIVIGTDVSRAQGPDAVDGKRFPGCILEQSVKFSGSHVVSTDEAAGLGIPSTGELPDQQVVAEASEIERSQSHAPRSVQPIAVFQSLQQAP